MTANTPEGRYLLSSLYLSPKRARVGDIEILGRKGPTQFIRDLRSQQTFKIYPNEKGELALTKIVRATTS